jgi:hypothetical protein
MPASTPTRAIDRLRKAANLEPTKKNVELSDGTIFEMWVSPLTMAERERAQKQAKSDDANAFALQLLISKALDENGSQAVRPRRNRRTQERSQGQGSPDPDARHPHRRLRGYGPKVLAAELRKDNWLMLQFGVAKELGLSLTTVCTTFTPEELLGWSAYFSILNEDQQKEIDKAKRRR